MWILPTLNRIEKLRAFIKSALEAETSTPGLIVIDVEDWAKNKELYSEMPKILGWKYVVTKGVSMGDKTRDCWADLKDSNWAGILNDDHFVVTKNWDKKLLQKLDGKNFVSANDRWVAPRKATTAT